MQWDEQVRRLLRKAAADQRAMNALIAVGTIEHETIGFHAQQAVEKYLKALLSHCRITSHRTHDLWILIDLLNQNGHEVPSSVEEAVRLSPYAVQFRYDEELSPSETMPDLQWMSEEVEAVRRWVEIRLAK